MPKMDTPWEQPASTKIENLKGFMESEGYDVWTHTYEVSGQETECLCLNLPDDDYGTDRFVQFFFLPLDGLEPLGDVDCLQVVYGLPITLNEDHFDTVMSALDVLNGMLLGGYIGLLENNLCYRYSYFVPKVNGIALGGESYLDPIMFLITTVVGFTELIRGVNSGTVDPDEFTEALNQLQRIGRASRDAGNGEL